MKPLFASGSGFLIRSSTHFCDRGILVSMEPVDKAAIFKELCCRNQLRREARLPLLDLRAEYNHVVMIAEAARLRAIREPYVSQVRAEILDRMRAKYGPHWPSDSGGRWMLMGLVRKAVLDRFGF